MLRIFWQRFEEKMQYESVTIIVRFSVNDPLSRISQAQWQIVLIRGLR